MRISIIGSGNVATHLAAALKNAGHKIVQVYSRTMQNAALLAYHVGAEAIDDLDSININTDVFMIAVSDDAITSIAKSLAVHNIPVVHTSGATELQALTEFTGKAGVFYPLQTLSKQKEVDFSTVPLCIEGANETITSLLETLASTISKNVYRVNSDQRKVLHLAAVFACNFTNYFYQIAQQLLTGDKLPFALLRPLILETALKVQEREPSEVQTGPAIRNDVHTMDVHLQMLKDYPELEEMYGLISQAIIKNDPLKHAQE